MIDKLGPTGDWPEGMINDDDEGGLNMAIGIDPNGLIRMEFGMPVAWLVMRPEHAIEIAKALLRHAGAKKIEIEL